MRTETKQNQIVVTSMIFRQSKHILGVGSPSEEIVSTAKTKNVEMIVIGSRQLKGNNMITLGSVARRVSETASCPVKALR